MRTKFLISLILLVIIAFSSCDKELARYDLTVAQEQLIPYVKGQIINFINNEGLIIALTVTESDQYWYRPDNGDGLFRGDYVLHKWKYVTLKSEPNNFVISLKMVAQSSSVENRCVFYISIDRLDFSLDANPEGIFLTNSYTYLHDSIEINGKVYYNVVEQNRAYSEVPLQLFYNKTHGIIQINRDGESFLTLKP